MAGAREVSDLCLAALSCPTVLIQENMANLNGQLSC
jgi:hypothetical protein